jgi:hypothetical protein
MKIPFLFLTIVVFTACQNNNSQNTAAGDDENVSSGYAYKIARPDQWEWGDKNNIKMALNALKAYENGNISGAFKDYADTVLIQMDGFERRMTKDSLLALFLRERSSIRRMGIEMHDFVSLRSKNGRSQYVSLWYKQLWEDQNGVIDSMECMDDLAFKNGKIVLWNEKVRRFPKPMQ